MSDLIDRQSVIDAIDDYAEDANKNYEIDKELGLMQARNIVIEAQSVQPVIIRCKDCSQIWQSGKAIINGTSTKIYKCKWWDNRAVSPYGFCYMAERKIDE